MPNFINKKIEEFRKQFAENEVWWQECLQEMRFGDPDLKKLEVFLAQALADQREETIKECAEVAMSPTSKHRILALLKPTNEQNRL